MMFPVPLDQRRASGRPSSRTDPQGLATHVTSSNLVRDSPSWGRVLTIDSVFVDRPERVDKPAATDFVVDHAA